MLYPPWLLNDDGTPLPGVRTSLAGKLCLWEADGTHAPLDSGRMKWVFSGLNGTLGAEHVIATVSPAMPTFHPKNPDFRGLLLSSCSTGKTACNSDMANLTPAQLREIPAAWCSPTAPVMSAVPCLPIHRRPDLRLLPESLTTDGESGTCEIWSLYAGVTLSSFRGAVADILQAHGKLCDTIKAILIDVLCGILGVGPNVYGALPPFTLPGPFADKYAERQAYVDVATKVARRANVVTVDGPVIVPVDPLEEYWRTVAQPAGVTTREFSDNYFRLKGK